MKEKVHKHKVSILLIYMPILCSVLGLSLFALRYDYSLRLYTHTVAQLVTVFGFYYAMLNTWKKRVCMTNRLFWLIFVAAVLIIVMSINELANIKQTLDIELYWKYLFRTLVWVSFVCGTNLLEKMYRAVKRRNKCIKQLKQ